MTTKFLARLSPCPVMVLFLLALSLAIAASGCSGPPDSTSGKTSGPDPAKPAIESASAALDKKDAAAFEGSLSQSTLEQMKGNLDLSGPGAAKLATALRSAAIVKEYDLVRVYEMKIDGESISFYAVKEDGKWKIGGL